MIFRKNSGFKFKRAAGRVILPAVLSVCLAFVPAGSVYASKVTDLQNQKKNTQEKLNAARNNTDSLEGQEEAVTEAMEAVNADLVQNMASVNILQNQIDELNAQIAETQKEYDKAVEDEKEQYEAMKIRIRYMYEKGDTTYMQILMSSTSFADMLNKTGYAQKLYDYDRKMLEKYQETVQRVADTKQQLETEKSEQEEAMVGLQEEQDALNTQLDDLRAKHGDIENQIAAAQAQARELAAQLEQQTAAISKAVDEEAKAAEAAALAEAQRKAAEEAAKKAAEEKAKSTEKTTESSTEAATEESKTEDNKGEAESDSSDNEESSESDSGSESSSSKPSAPAVNSNGVSGSTVVSYASQFLGNPYVYGGSSLTNGTDCSGFTMSVYQHFGYSLGRTDVSQRSNGIAVDSLEDAQPGDIICYPGHVAIYCGNGMIIHASTPATGIKYSSATYRTYLCIRRIIY